MFSRFVQGSVLAVSMATLSAQEATKPPSPNAVTISFGTYAFRKPTEIYKQFQPATVELSRLLTAELGKPAHVELRITKTYEECLDEFVTGKIDIVRLGPASYVLAKQRCDTIQLLAAEHEDSRGVGLIVVRDDSPARKLSDLTGKRFAFGDDQSTIGRYLSQAELVRAGVNGSDLSHHEYLQRHDIVFKAVEIGDYDAGALHADTWKELNGKATTKLRVLHAFDNAPKPWVARSGLDEAMTKALRTCLLSMKDKAALKALKVPGFVTTSDAEFEFVRKGMQDAANFAGETKTPTEPEPVPKPAPTKG
jgi:phosphonate transport system substrate-binding protein